MRRSTPIAVALAAAAIAAGVLLATAARRAERSRSAELTLATGPALFVVGPQASGQPALREVRAASGGARLASIALGLRIDGGDQALEIAAPERRAAGAYRAVARARVVGVGTPDGAAITWRAGAAPGSLWIGAAPDAASASVSLTLSFALARGRALVPGAGLVEGEIAREGTTVIVLDEGPALAIVAAHGALVVEPHPGASGLHELRVVSPAERGAGELGLVVGATVREALAGAASLRGEPTREVRGRVTSGSARDVEVWGVDAEGRPWSFARPADDGAFVAVAPPRRLSWFGTLAGLRATPVASDAEGAPLELPLAPGGQVVVQVRDADSGEPLTARVLLSGVAPTASPNLGPDFRASGAGPLADLARGEATFPLPSGRYVVRATRGLEWTMAEASLDVGPGTIARATLGLRHVVDARGLVGCDFHVHARPSFDAPVEAEDRVLSLVAAGVDFAVPSEHNLVGSYADALAATSLEGKLGWVPGVEITTFDPPRGHFNVFPFTDDEAPPYRRKPLAEVFARARAGDPTRVLQVNHPRLGKIGYFALAGLDPRTGVARRGAFRADFDAVEVFSGVDAQDQAQIDAMLEEWLASLARGRRWVGTADSDSHRVQFQWAGYPRTYVELPPAAAGDEGGAIDATALVAALKQGHASGTSGPVVEASIGAAHPGDTVRVAGDRVSVAVRVRAAPWVDVRSVELHLGPGAPAARVAVEARPAALGAPGTLDEARRSTVRFEGTLDAELPRGARLAVVVVRGERRLDDVLPGMPLQPFAFTNPIWIER